MTCAVLVLAAAVNSRAQSCWFDCGGPPRHRSDRSVGVVIRSETGIEPARQSASAILRLVNTCAPRSCCSRPKGHRRMVVAVSARRELPTRPWQAPCPGARGTLTVELFGVIVRPVIGVAWIQIGPVAEHQAGKVQRPVNFVTENGRSDSTGGCIAENVRESDLQVESRPGDQLTFAR
jgi:hypothetical protein